MTVWKDTRVLAAKSAAAAIALLNGKKPAQTGTVANAGGTPAKLPAYIIAPVSINKTNFRQLFNGYLKKSNVCKGEYAKYCVKPA